MRTIKGLLIGAIAGGLDLIPMILQKLSLDANLSAFSMWLMIGFLLAWVKLPLPPVLKGILVSFSVLIPSAILIGFKDPIGLLPIALMTIVLGSLSGLASDRWNKEV